MKAMAAAMCYLDQYIQENNILVCFPDSVGWINMGDFSQIVRYDPES